MSRFCVSPLRPAVWSGPSTLIQSLASAAPTRPAAPVSVATICRAVADFRSAADRLASAAGASELSALRRMSQSPIVAGPPPVVMPAVPHLLAVASVPVPGNACFVSVAAPADRRPASPSRDLTDHLIAAVPIDPELSRLGLSEIAAAIPLR